MIDERHEELAALYAFDLLEGEELAHFEAALARDSALQALVRSLRDASTSLAHSSALPPPAALRQRILENLRDPVPASPAPQIPDNIIRPAFFRSARIPWAAAACFALLAAWLGQRFVSARGELAQLRRQNAIADVTLQSIRQQLEGDSILVRRQREELDLAQSQLAQARSDLERTAAQLASANTDAADRARQLVASDRQLAEARRELASRDAQVATLTQRVDALAGASVELGRQLEQARNNIARLTGEILLERDLAEYKISVLASLVQDNPQALAVAVWNPAKKEGVLKVEKLPALAANQDYQLWVVDPQYKDPVDGGVFTVDSRSGEARITFTAKQPVSAVNAFAISLERKGGVPKAEGPILLLGK